MPLYEYECQQCKERVEVIQRFSDAPSTECPQCGGPLKKLLSSPAIQFKGSGFYKTDYGSGKQGGKNDSKSESQSESKSDSKSETKSEGKSEGKSEVKSEAKSEAKSE